MFWLGMSFGLFLSVFVGKYKYLSNGLFWLTVLLIPYLVVKHNRVKYTEDKIFLNSQDKNLMGNLPKQLLWVIFAMFMAIAFTGSIIDTYWKDTSDLIAFPLIFSIFFLVPTLYFIYKNCPISILFNKNAWQEGVIGMRGSAYNTNCTSSGFRATHYNSVNHHKTIKSPDIINDPAYRYLSSNIYNSNR